MWPDGIQQEVQDRTHIGFIDSAFAVAKNFKNIHMQHVLSDIHYFLRKVSKPNNQQIGTFKLIHKFSNIRGSFENSMVKVIKLISSRNNFDTINSN